MSVSRVVFGAALAAVSVLGVAAGCSTTEPTGGGTSQAGNSCTRTFDCASGLSCIQNVCVSVSTTMTVDGGADGTTMMVTGPQLGQKGDACQTNLNCASGLVCITSGAGGVCDIASYGLTPTGNVCGECKTGADCCELPTPLGLETVYIDAGFESIVTAHTCQDLLNFFLSGSTAACATAFAGTTTSIACFYYATYCAPECSATTWNCTNNRCLFAGSCMSSTPNDQNGCPSRSRTGLSLSTACSTAHTCGGASVGGGTCTTAADCNGSHASDNTAIQCVAGDCACYQGGCYLACASNLDCAFGYSCNTTTNLCTQQSACTVDADCALTTRNVQAKCVTGTCKVPCASDHDCSASGDISGTSFGGSVCQAGFCASIGCSSDLDCSSGGLHEFCVTPPATPAAGTVVASAVTN